VVELPGDCDDAGAVVELPPEGAFVVVPPAPQPNSVVDAPSIAAPMISVSAFIIVANKNKI
jgi:hypothetical protein